MKTDYPKIDIYVDGVYKRSTTWSKTCRGAIEKYKAAHPAARVAGVVVTAKKSS